MNAKRKLQKQAGFTLAETLLAVMILLLVSGIVASGVPAAKNAYEKVVLGANAQVLLSTTISALRDELGSAWEVETGTDEEGRACVTYFSANTGARSRIYQDNNTIMVQRFSEVDGIDLKAGQPSPLVSDAATTKELCLTYGAASYNEETGVVTFSDFSVYRKSEPGGRPLAGLSENGSGDLSIRVFSAKAAS